MTPVGKITRNSNKFDHHMMDKNHEVERRKVGAEAELPLVEKSLYLLIYLYFLAKAVFEIYSFPLGKLRF